VLLWLLVVGMVFEVLLFVGGFCSDVFVIVVMDFVCCSFGLCYMVLVFM